MPDSSNPTGYREGKLTVSRPVFPHGMYWIAPSYPTYLRTICLPHCTAHPTGEAPALLLTLLSPSVGSVQAARRLLSKYPSSERVYHTLTLKQHLHPSSHLPCTAALQGSSCFLRVTVEATEKERSEDTCRGSLSIAGIPIQAVRGQNPDSYPPAVLSRRVLNELMSEWTGEFR